MMVLPGQPNGTWGWPSSQLELVLHAFVEFPVGNLVELHVPSVVL